MNHEPECHHTSPRTQFFHTSFGDFATYSYEVVAAEDLGRIAHALLADRERARQRVTCRATRTGRFKRCR